MYKMNNPNEIVIHVIPGRHLTVVRGNSGVVYPFYKSTGKNSECQDLWFPWMGYFDALPEQEIYPEYEHSIYMVKPSNPSLSQESISSIIKYLGAKAAVFMWRIGNDETLAISCSLGGGYWDELPEFKKAIMSSEATQKYIKSLTIVANKEDRVTVPGQSLVHFSGRFFSGTVKAVEAAAAVKMENITAEESKKYASVFSVQEQKHFPDNEQLDMLKEEIQGRRLRTNYLKRLKKFGYIDFDEQKQLKDSEPPPPDSHLTL